MVRIRQRRFPRRRTSARAARDYVIATLVEWGLTDRLDDMRLCVSELAANALLHGVPPGREFCVRLSAQVGTVRLEVRDSGGGRPEVRSPEPGSTTGRGLGLAMEIADGGGVIRHPVGKTVWLDFEVTRSAPSDSVRA